MDKSDEDEDLEELQFPVQGKWENVMVQCGNTQTTTRNEKLTRNTSQKHIGSFVLLEGMYLNTQKLVT